MKNDFIKAWNAYLVERSKQVEKISAALEIAFCSFVGDDYDTQLLNIARIMFELGCRIKDEKKN